MHSVPRLPLWSLQWSFVAKLVDGVLDIGLAMGTDINICKYNRDGNIITYAKDQLQKNIIYCI